MRGSSHGGGTNAGLGGGGGGASVHRSLHASSFHNEASSHHHHQLHRHPAAAAATRMMVDESDTDDSDDDNDEFGWSYDLDELLSHDGAVRATSPPTNASAEPATKEVEEEEDHRPCATAPSSLDEKQPASNGPWTSASGGDNEGNNSAGDRRSETVPVPVPVPHDAVAESHAARLALLERNMSAKARGTGAILIQTTNPAALAVPKPQPPPPGTQVLVLDKSLVKSKADALAKASSFPTPVVPPPPTSSISRDIAQDMALLSMRKKKKSRSSRGLHASSASQRSGRALVPHGAPLSLVYAESNLANKSEYMEALHERGVDVAITSASDASKKQDILTSSCDDRDTKSTDSDDNDGEISVPSLSREKQSQDSGAAEDGTPPSLSRVPMGLFQLEASIRASQQGVTTLAAAGPGAFQVQVPAASRPSQVHDPPPPSTSTSYSALSPTPELNPYVVEARLVMDDPNDDEDDVSDGGNDGDQNKRNHRPQPSRRNAHDDVEMALVEAKPVVEATPVYEPSAWKRRCTWFAIALAILVAVGAAIGITLGVTTNNAPTSANAPDPSTNETQSGQHSSTSNTSTVTSADPIGDLRMALSNSTLEAIKDDQTPQAKAYMWATAHVPTEGDIVSRLVQRFAMATLYYATDGTQWSQSDGWLNASVHECDWYYDSSAELACYDGTDTITRIGLSENNLQGLIPHELGLLSSIESLLLSANDGLVGPIPDSVASIASLSGLFMSANALSGSLPTLQPSAAYVFLWSNRFSGSFPDAYVNLTDVRDFVVQNNLLTGRLPVHMWHRWGKAESIDVSDNNLQGTIGSEIGFLTGLTSLGLMSNQFTGPLPTELGMLAAVKDMYLGDNSFSSTVPTEIANMKSLVYLDFFDNELTGRLPSELNHLSKLEELCIEANLLTGEIPTELASLSNLTKLSLFGNTLSGTIPSQIAELKALNTLDLDFNALTGTIPMELGDLRSISGIHLASNYLNGTIPTELGGLASVVELDLSDNELTGTIPTQLATLTSLQVLNLQENYLTGSVPFELCALLTVKSLTLKVDCDKVACSCGCHCASNATARNLRYSV